MTALGTPTLLPRKLLNMKKLLFLFLLLPMLSRGAEIITVTFTVTNAGGIMGNTNTLVLNGDTRTFTNSTTASPSTLIQQTNTPAWAATNILNQIGQYSFGAGFYYTITNSTNVVIRGTPSAAMVASLAGAWGTISYSTNQIATPTYIVRVPHTNESVTVRTNIASGLANYLNLSTNAVATNASALSNYVHKGAGIQQVIRTSLQVTQLNGMVSALTNGYWTNATLDKMTGTNGRFYGGLQSLGTGALSTQLGTNTTAGGTESVAIGASAYAPSNYTVAIGTSAVASNNYAMAIGNGAIAGNVDSFAVGRATLAAGVASVAVGPGSVADGWGSAAIGNGAEIVGSNSLAVGTGAAVSSDRSIAIGATTSVTATNSIAIGYAAAASHSNSVALGGSVSTTASNQIRIGTTAHVVSVPGRLEGTITNGTYNGTNIWNGDISFPPTTSTSAATTNVLATGTNVILRVTGTPGAAWTLAGIAGPNRDGLFRIIYNDTGFTLTVGNEAGTAPDASTRIRTMTGADVSTGTNSVCQFFYDSTRSRWIMISHNP